MPQRIRKAILGRKVGMSQLFDADGVRMPVTLIEAGPCVVLQVKTQENDGYGALQVGFEDTRKGLKKPQEGHCQKAGTAVKKFVREIPIVAAEVAAKPGDTISVAVLDGVASVDVTGITKGRGFTGNVKRWNQRIGPRAHGSKCKREFGSAGMHQDPGRILKGKHFPGQYGAERVKTRNLRVLSMNPAENLLVVKGAIPGPNGGYLYIEESLT
ncbi:MAG: 50S ribosomal protein L3 [Planctomycetota bacterium]